jgi:hypothetical protein
MIVILPCPVNLKFGFFMDARADRGQAGVFPRRSIGARTVCDERTIADGKIDIISSSQFNGTPDVDGPYMQ